MFMELFPCRRSPLECASYGGFVNCMAVLLENGCDVNTRDNEARLAGDEIREVSLRTFFSGHHVHTLGFRKRASRSDPIAL